MNVGDSCPTNILGGRCLGTWESTAATENRNDTCLVSNTWGGASYDLLTGRIATYAGSMSCESGSEGHASAGDVYTVRGIAAGTPLMLTVRFSVVGYVAECPTGGGGNSSTLTVNGETLNSSDRATTLQIEAEVVVDEPFHKPSVKPGYRCQTRNLSRWPSACPATIPPEAG